MSFFFILLYQNKTIMDSNTRQLLTAIRNKKDLIAMGYQKLVVSGVSSQALTVPSAASYAEIRVESGTTTGIIMRYLMLGNTTLPTTTDGMALTYLDLFDITNGDNIANFRVIAVSGTHTLHVQYYK